MFLGTTRNTGNRGDIRSNSASGELPGCGGRHLAGDLAYGVNGRARLNGRYERRERSSVPPHAGLRHNSSHYILLIVLPALPPIRVMPRVGDARRRQPELQPCRGDSPSTGGALPRGVRTARRLVAR